VSYTATVAYSGPATLTPVARADLQGLLSRSSALSRPGTIRVDAVGEVIVLRGKVADESERRLVEGMVRLEPGVHEVRNELEIGP
jgi:osmotically-inducible protein OsmY